MSKFIATVCACLLSAALLAVPAGGAVVEAVILQGHNISSDAIIDDTGLTVAVALPVNGTSLQITRCLDAACAQTTGVSTVAGVAAVPAFPKLALDGAGNPVIAYGRGEPETSGGNVTVGSSARNLEFIRCLDATCTAVEGPVVLDASGNVDQVTGIRVDAQGNPAIVYGTRTPNATASLIRCNDPACAGNDESVTALDPALDGELHLRVTNNPVIVSGAGVLLCDDPLCADETPADLPQLSQTQSQLNAEENLVIAGFDLSTRRPAAITCQSADCDESVMTPFSNVAVAPVGLSFAADGRPVLVLSNQESLLALVCDTVTCSGEEFATAFAADRTLRDTRVVDGNLVTAGYRVADGAGTTVVNVCDSAECVVGTAPPMANTTPEQEAAIAHAIEISQERFPDPQLFDPIVIATIGSFADALAGTPLTKFAPLLLTTGEILHPDVAAELDRLGGNQIYILGGTAAISQAVEDQLQADGNFITRLQGPSRIETSIAVANEARSEYGDFDDFGVGLLARAFGVEGNPTAAWADAITAGGYLASSQRRIALAPSEPGNEQVDSYIGGAFDDLILLGGTAALSAGYDNEVSRRVAGASRFDTARQIALQLWEVPEEGERTYLILDTTSEFGWAYGLPAAGLSADLLAPVLAVGGSTPPPPETLAAVAGCGDQVTLRAIGPVSQDVMDALDAVDADPC